VEPTLKYQPGVIAALTWTPLAGSGTVHGRQFDWGGLLPKRNGGARRFASRGRTSRWTCKGTSELDCEADKPSRCESRT
jgi:hypothetical protein